MEGLYTISQAAFAAGLIEWLSAFALTDVVFIFLCSKPVFIFAALVVGIVGFRTYEGEHPRRLLGDG